MTLVTATNAQVDAAAALVPAPYGPLVRVTDVEVDFPAPNSDMKIELTSALSVTVFLSYEELLDAVLYTPALISQHSGGDVNAQMEHVHVLMRVLAENMLGFAGPPYTSEEAQAILDALRTLPINVAQPPNFDHSYLGTSTLQAAFTVSVVGDPDAAVTDASTGDILFYAWNWGDDSPWSIGAAPAAHTYAANDTYTITLYVIGRAGYSVATEEAVIAGVV